jgi:putative ABC transport system permease protein
MTRAQTRASVRLEAVLVALLGTGLGVLTGVFLGWSIGVTMRDQGITTFNVPVVSLVVIVLLALAGALVASLRPSRRAAKLDVLRAIATT